jgi:hypothetical protein
LATWSSNAWTIPNWKWKHYAVTSPVRDDRIAPSPPLFSPHP